MSWHDQLKGDSLTWLLENESSGIRYLALRDLADRPAPHTELSTARRAAHRNGPIAEILNQMDGAGFWAEPGAGYYPKYRSSVWTLVLLAQLGARAEEDGRIARAIDYILEHSFIKSGQFSATGTPSGCADCLQGELCWALLELGCRDERLDTAYDWMARSVTGEGFAPAGERHAESHYFSGKCGPTFACGSNNRLPCAWGAAKVMLALGILPEEKRTPPIQRAIQHGVDFFFSVDPAGAAYPSGYSKKPSQNWWKFGFPVFYVTDLLQIVEALVSLGYADDPRLANAITLIREKQDAQGRWALEYDYTGKTWCDFGEKKQPNPWVTLRVLRVLKAAG